MIDFIYLILYSITFINIINSYYIYYKLKSFIPILPIWIIFYWSLYGAYDWIPFKQTNDVHYLETIMYKVNINENYLYAITLYSVFLLTVNLVLFMYAYSCRKRVFDADLICKNKITIAVIKESKIIIITLVILFSIFAYLSMMDIWHAISLGISAYGMSRFNSQAGLYYNLGRFCGDTVVYLSAFILLLIKDIKNITLYKTFILLIVAFYFIINLVLGNRNTLLTAMVLFSLLYTEFYGIKSILKVRIIFSLIVALFLIQSISFVRNFSPTDFMKKMTITDLFMEFGKISESPEKFANHFSMYAIIENKVPVNYGSSVVFLTSALIPTFFGVPRTEELYRYYSRSVHLTGKTEFTINHAAAWYLNFGFPGIILGALIWAALIIFMFNNYQKTKSIYWLLASALFSASSIQMIRGAGIETYKAILLQTVLLPVLIIYSSQIKLKFHKDKTE